MTVTQPEFGQRLRQLRLQRGLSQRAVAGDMVTPSYVSIVESGSRVPTLDVVVHMARQLSATLEELLGEEDSRILVQAAARPGPDVVTLISEQAAQEYLDAGDYRAARQALEEALEGCAERGDSASMIRLGLRLQPVLSILGDRAARLRLVDRLLEQPLPVGAGRVGLALRCDHAAALRDAGRLAEALAAARNLLTEVEQGDSHGGEHERVRCLAILISTLGETGEGPTAASLVPRMLELAERNGSPGLRGRALWAAALANTQAGRVDEAVEQILTAADLLGSPELPLAEWARLCRAVVAVLLDSSRGRERRQRIEQWLRDAERSAQLIKSPADIAAAASLRGRFQLSCGHAEQAAQTYAAILGADSPLVGLERIRAQLGYAEALERAGSAEQAAEAMRAAADMLEESGALQRAIQIWRRIDQLRKD